MDDQFELFPVILSGGVGARLWPLSQRDHPKPFLPLPDGQTCLQKTYRRIGALPNVGRILTLTRHDLYQRSMDEFCAAFDAAYGAAFEDGESQKLPPCSPPHHSFILEPMGRNTAPPLLLAALHYCATQGPNAVLLALPADHVIEDDQEFARAVAAAKILAAQGKIVVFGIKPTHADTGFGYIECDGPNVKRFVEKPSRELADDYVASGRYVWNAGIVCATAASLIREFERHQSPMLATLQTCYLNAQKSNAAAGDIIHIAARDFEAVEPISIDYAILEKSANLSVVVCRMGWRDIGSWKSMAELSPADLLGNRAVGEVVVQDSKGCYIHALEKMVAVLGVQDLVIVDTPDALLVAHKDYLHKIKSLTDLSPSDSPADSPADSHDKLQRPTDRGQP